MRRCAKNKAKIVSTGILLTIACGRFGLAAESKIKYDMILRNGTIVYGTGKGYWAISAVTSGYLPVRSHNLEARRVNELVIAVTTRLSDSRGGMLARRALCTNGP